MQLAYPYTIALHTIIIFLLLGNPIQVKNNSTVNGIDFYVDDAFGQGLFDSCKDVKFGSMNSRAIEFIGAGAKNFKGN